MTHMYAGFLLNLRGMFIIIFNKYALFDLVYSKEIQWA